MNTYEGMFLLDNEVVRADWQKAKSVVTDVLQKHGAEVVTARRWDERPLAYPIKGRHRATFLLAYFEMDGDGVPPFHRDLEIREDVLRYLQVSVAKVPAEEQQLSEAEGADDFVVPEPPKDAPPPPRKLVLSNSYDPTRTVARSRRDRESVLLVTAPSEAATVARTPSMSAYSMK